MDSCPVCHRSVSIQAVAVARCKHCQTDLTQSQDDGLPLDGIGQQSQQVIQSWFMNGPSPATSPPYSLPNQPSALLYYVMTQLGSNLKLRRSSVQSSPILDRDVTSLRAKQRPTPRQSYSHYRIAFQALQDWPTGFYRFLQNPLSLARSEADAPRRNDQDAVYSEWLAPIWCAPGLEFVHEALEEYLIDHRPTLTNWRYPRRYRGQVGSALRLSFVTINEAALLLRISHMLVWRLAQLGYVTLVEGLSRRYYLDQLVRRSTVWAVRRAWSVALSWRDATRWLGLSDEVLSDFVHAGLLTTCASSDRDPQGLFSKQALADLWSALVPRVRTVLAITPELLELSTAADLVNQIGQNTAHLVVGVMQDQLRAYCQGPTLSAIDRLLFSKRDIQVYLAQHLNQMKGTEPNFEKGRMNR